MSHLPFSSKLMNNFWIDKASKFAICLIPNMSYVPMKNLIEIVSFKISNFVTLCDYEIFCLNNVRDQIFLLMSYYLKPYLI